MDVVKICSALGNETRYHIARAVAKEPIAAIDIYKRIKGDTSLKNRESIYKALEILRKAGVLKKFYDEQDNKLKYAIVENKIVIELK